MSSAKITMLGLYEYHPEIFDLMQLPDGIDRNILIDNILLKTADFEVLYPQPKFMQMAIENWSKKSMRTFEKWVTAVNLQYQPIENYDRIEDIEDTGNLQNVSNGKTTDKRSAFDSNTFENDAQSALTSSGQSNTHNIRHARMHGNIGVTTSQQMLESEYNIAKWNLYDQITDLFMQEFIIMVY